MGVCLVNMHIDTSREIPYNNERNNDLFYADELRIFFYLIRLFSVWIILKAEDLLLVIQYSQFASRPWRKGIELLYFSRNSLLHSSTAADSHPQDGLEDGVYRSVLSQFFPHIIGRTQNIQVEFVHTDILLQTWQDIDECFVYVCHFLSSALQMAFSFLARPFYPFKRCAYNNCWMHTLIIIPFWE